MDPNTRNALIHAVVIGKTTFYTLKVSLHPYQPGEAFVK